MIYFCVYVTFLPEGTSRQTMVQTNIFDRILNSMVEIDSKTNSRCNFMICGDFNARTSVDPDFVPDDTVNHIGVLPDDYAADIPLPRFSKDKVRPNDNGSSLLAFCKESGLRIMNGRAGNDTGVGEYTYVGSRGSSVIDYVITSTDMFNKILNFDVCKPNILSDHCAVRFSLICSEPFTQNKCCRRHACTYKLQI